MGESAWTFRVRIARRAFLRHRALLLAPKMLGNFGVMAEVSALLGSARMCKLVHVGGGFIPTCWMVDRTLDLACVVTLGVATTYGNPVGAVVWCQGVGRHAVFMVRRGSPTSTPIRTISPRMLCGYRVNIDVSLPWVLVWMLSCREPG
ncbi:hypothetical protein B296_00046263 [Ensete ventricosum]|uniref:Uncharacterized protein n=1 Tax=Ensete ventricosum TaxID=4639 RepID=A0A426YYS3_ENSVE|nr:hypothetical protein B296_00046263 [Ensete ventricosum]